MSNTITLQLPADLRGKLETEARRLHVSPAQYIISVLSETLAYNDALEQVQAQLRHASDKSWTDLKKNDSRPRAVAWRRDIILQKTNYDQPIPPQRNRL